MKQFFILIILYINFFKTEQKDFIENNNIIFYNKQPNISLSNINNYFIFLYNPWSNFSKHFSNELKKANIKIQNKTLGFLILIIDVTLIEKEKIFQEINIDYNENNIFSKLIFISNKTGIQYFENIPKLNYIQQFILYSVHDGIININELEIKRIIEDNKNVVLFTQNKTIVHLTKKILKKFNKVFYLINSNKDRIIINLKGKIKEELSFKGNFSLINNFIEKNYNKNNQIYTKINLKFIQNIFMQKKNFSILFYNRYINLTENMSNFVERIKFKNEKYKNITFAITDINNKIQYKLMKFIGIEEKNFPSFSLVLFNESDYEINIMKEKLTENNIINFIDAHLNLKTKKTILLEKNILIGNIIEIKNIKSYEEYIFNNININRVIFIYNDWCSFCIQAKYLYKKLSNQNKNIKSFTFSQINIEKFSNLKSSPFYNFFQNMKYIPTIILIPFSNKNPINDYIIYNGDYIYSKLLDFIEKYNINNEL